MGCCGGVGVVGAWAGLVVGGSAAGGGGELFLIVGCGARAAGGVVVGVGGWVPGV